MLQNDWMRMRIGDLSTRVLLNYNLAITWRRIMKQKILPYVVIRTYSAGVHVGELAERRGKEVDLVNARRIWSWKGANTLHEIALRGVGAGSRVSETVEAITLTEVVEIITATDKARKNLVGASWA
jgi:hypothetical protein